MKRKGLVAYIANKPMEFASATSQICLAPDLQKRSSNIYYYFFPQSGHVNISIVCVFVHTNLYLCNLGELAARKVNEGQIAEAKGYRRVALDKRSSVGICGQLLMNNGIMTKETSMGTESDTTQVTPSTRKTILTLT